MTGMAATRKLRLAVRPVPDKGDGFYDGYYEVLIFVDEVDFLPRTSWNMIGLDPDDILFNGALLPTSEPHEAIVARCDCGVLGCSDLSTTVSANDGLIFWNQRWIGDGLCFEREQYMQEVARATEDYSWELPDRTVLRLLSPLVDQVTLAERGLQYHWCYNHQPEVLTVYLASIPDTHTFMLHIPWQGQRPEQMTQTVAATLGQPPATWLDVEWKNTRWGDHDVPAFLAPHWRRRLAPWQCRQV